LQGRWKDFVDHAVDVPAELVCARFATEAGEDLGVPFALGIGPEIVWGFGGFGELLGIGVDEFLRAFLGEVEFFEQGLGLGEGLVVELEAVGNGEVGVLFGCASGGFGFGLIASLRLPLTFRFRSLGAG
jgi:hypothetical protein